MLSGLSPLRRFSATTAYPCRPQNSLTRACFRIKIEDEHSFQNRVGSRELLSWACIRLDRLRRGYRFVGLLDPKGNPIPDGKLLVKVDKIER